MSELSEKFMERLRVRARRAKAIAMKKHKEGDLAGAKEYAVKAKTLNPFLHGLVRLNAVLDVLRGFEKKIDGEVDWYAVLAVDPTADVVTIQRRNKKLLLYILMDDSDDSVGSIDEAKKILADCWISFCDENSKKLYDKRRQERADYVKQQQLKRASQCPSFTSNPVTLSAPNPPQRVSKENERMVQPPVRVSGQVLMSTVTPVTLSAPNPPENVSKENERMVQPPVRLSSKVPLFTSTPVILSALNPPQRVSKEKERMVQPPVRVSGQVPMSVPISTVTPVTLSAPNPPESVTKENERMVQPPVRVSGQVPLFTTNPVILSAHNPPQKVSKEKERMVQPPVRVSGQFPMSVPMSTVNPVTLSAPNPPESVSKENKRMVHPPVRVSGQVPMSTVTQVILSALNPPQRVSKENERMVQPPVRVSGKVPLSTSNPVILSALNPPQRVSKENERMVQPPVRVSGKPPLFTITPVILSPSPSQRPMMSNRELKGIFEVKVGQHFQLPSRISVDDLRTATQVPSLLAPKPVVTFPRLKTFDEEKEDLVDVNVEQFVQPPLPISSPQKRGIGGGSKRLAPPHMLHANKLRRINEDAGIRSIEPRGHNVVPSLERLVSACKQVNVASSSAAIPLQESKKCNAPNSVNTESTNKMVNVQWSKGVYPKKGDVWAMYENWSPFWGFSTPKVVNKYEMVEVLEDFDDVRGVTVVPLVKVSGFKAVFRRLPIPKTFPKKELARFSHQVASHLLTGHEGNNAPKGCLELDPAAMPPELLKVFTEEAPKSLKNQEEVFQTMNKEASVPVYKIKQEKMV